MVRLNFRGAVMAAGGLVLLANGVAAQEFPAYANRCLVSELQLGPVASDLCQPHAAVFGLDGPTVSVTGGLDVEATGSLGAPDADRASPKSD